MVGHGPKSISSREALRPSHLRLQPVRPCKYESYHRSGVRSECTQKIYQVLLLLIRQLKREALVIEMHYVEKRPCSAIVKIRCAGGKPPQDGTFQFADIAALACHHGASNICDLQPRSISASDRVNGQAGSIEGRDCRIIGRANLNRQRQRMIAGIRRVMTSGARSLDGLQPRQIIQTRNTSDDDGELIEECFSARNRLPISSILPGCIRPALIGTKYQRVERCPGWICSKYIVAAEIKRLRRQ